MGLYCVFVFIIGKEKENIEEHSHAVDDDDKDHKTNTDVNNDDDRCKVEVSRCLSSILESGEKPLESPGTALWRYNLFVRIKPINRPTNQNYLHIKS